MDDRPADLTRLLQERLRDVLASAAVLVVIVGSAVALLVGRVDLGVTLVIDGQQVVIDAVTPGSPASREGFVPGMLVLALNGQSLVRLPEPVEPDPEPSPTIEVSGSASPSSVPSPSVVPSIQATPSPGAETSAAASAPATGLAASPATGLAASPAPAGAGASPSVPAHGPDGPIPSPPAGPERPTIVPLDGRSLAALLSQPIHQLDAAWPSDLAEFPAGPLRMTYLGRDYLGELDRSGYLFAVGLLLLSGGWLLASGRVGEALRPLALPLAAAIAIPLLARPLEATWSAAAASIAAVAVPFGIAPLGLALADRIDDPEGRGIARMAAVGGSILAMLIGVARIWLPGASGYATDAGGAAANLSWILLAGAAALVPGVIAGLKRRPGEAPASGRRIVQSNELAVAGATPLVSLATGITSLPLLLPLSAWLGALAVAGRWTVRPLVRVAARATLQRDLVVAATEAERARVAAEIHDDALQELTLLVHRLEAVGDADGAAMARTVSERLRAICGDLRLPILDDLGVGPALDWLAERMEHLAGGPVHLERVGDVRQPPEVELAFFRIAQEAVGNAVRHGRPPITIRFHATAAGASLSVDDAGAGIDPEAVSDADGRDRFGILNMQQRAEQIGALLDIRPWPTGGTHVALEWRAA
jgi:signal transduction histidine kinase